MAYSTEGQASNAIPGLARQDSIHNGISDFGGVIERLAKLAETLRMVGVRVNGVRPEPVGKDQVDTPPSSIIADLRRKHSAITSLLGKCEDEAQRLASSIGGM